MKKKIGISFTRTNFQYYWNWFSTEDLLDKIELIELSFEKDNIDDFEKCDGFVLTGGVDIDTSLYGGATSYDHQPDQFQRERDLFEEKIFRYSQFHQLPVLGICRGLQLVNVLLGGKLIEDIDEANLVHKKEGDIDKQHPVIIEKNSLLAEITGAQMESVNSAHHQVVRPDALGSNLMVSAWSEDSIIEALEFKNKTGKAFMLCVQWHPERMKNKEQNPLSEKIRERFIAELKNK